MTNLFELPSTTFLKRCLKAGNYDESKHPRDEKGRWTAGGVAAALGGGALAAGAGLAGLAAAGTPLGRAAMPGVRRAVLGGRYRSAAERVRSARATDEFGGLNLSPQIRRALQRIIAAEPRFGREHRDVNLIRRATNSISSAGVRRRTAAAGGIARPTQFGTYNPVKPRRS